MEERCVRGAQRFDDAILPCTWLAAVIGCGLLLGTGAANAQVLQANDDSFSVRLGETLVVERFGVLENDILDGESAGESGATVDLVVDDVNHGTLALGSDGSFTYTVGPTFDGSDQFIYRAVSGTVTSQAIVTLTACEGGPQLFTCWKEAAFLSIAAANGLPSFEEGFEDDAVWAAARWPDSVLSVSSRGFEWSANDFDPTHLVSPFPPAPPPNEIITGAGAGRTGLWGAYDSEHGYALGSVAECQGEMPPEYCFHHDGITVAREPGSGPLHGAGGYFDTNTPGAKVAIVVDGDWLNPIGGGLIGLGAGQFFGVIDTGPTGFDEIQFREIDGRLTQQFLLFADDFTLLAEPIDAQVPSLDALGLAALAVALFVFAARSLRSRSA